VNDAKEIGPNFQFRWSKYRTLSQFESSFWDLAQVLQLPQTIIGSSADLKYLGEYQPGPPRFASSFLRAVFLSVEEHLGNQASWFTFPKRITQTYPTVAPCLYLLFIAVVAVTNSWSRLIQVVTIKLGEKEVIVKSDGGLSLNLSTLDKPLVRLILCIAESSRKPRYSAFEFKDMHVAQIYTQLLGQVCHQSQYLGNIDGEQEVSTFSTFLTYGD
jgi:hypothetical protein